jgi:GT2 family glycosyltransferase
MKLQIVAVQYLEPEYNATLRSINACGIPTIFVDRKGVGSLAEAYNRGFKKVEAEYTWFISNISFDKTVPQRLLKSIEGFEGVHPQFDSHHKFIKHGKGIQQAPFLEFTAPLIRSEVFREIGLNEEMPYWGHDIAFGIECEKKGYKLAVDHTTKIDHVYIWDSKKNKVTEERKRRRLETDKQTETYLDTHYNGWRKRVYF